MVFFLSGVVLLAQDGTWPPEVPEEARGKPPGLYAPAGPRGEPKRVKSLEIREKGAVVEDTLVDAEYGDRDAVHIKADGVVLRRCEIRNGTKDAVEVYASDVLIENCRIHHFLGGSLKEPRDAHGITGRPRRLIIRNCEIYYVSGDAVQFDPGRGSWSDVLIEHSEFWTGPLPKDAAGFKKGEQPGENGLDTKQLAKNGRSKVLVRNSVFRGWRKGGQIPNAAALNLKNHVDVRVENCVFYDNEISLRLRGVTGKMGGAAVATRDCAFYRCDIAVRLEDQIRNVKMSDPVFGAGVKARFQGRGPGLSVTGEKEGGAFRPASEGPR